MKILGISGSLRRASFNTALLRAMEGILAGKAGFEIYTCGDLPLYNADIDGESKPEPVVRFRELVSGAEALIFATPEYNHGIPGVLKNAIDWASRPAFKAPLTHKPAGVLSASRGAVGGARAQAALRQILGGTMTPILPHVEMLVPSAAEKFDEAGNLTDARTRERMERYAAEFVEWVRRPRSIAKE